MNRVSKNFLIESLVLTDFSLSVKFHFITLAFLFPLTLSAQEMGDPVVKKTIICSFDYHQEPWENPFMLFMLPGLIIWLIGAIWSFRKNNIRGAIILQILGSIEVVIGGLFALLLAMKSVASGILGAAGIDPSIAAVDYNYSASIAIIGLILHFVLLTMTLTLAIRAKRNLRKSQPVP